MPEYVTIPEAVERAGVSRSTIDRWRRRGFLRTYKALGQRGFRVDLEELRALRENPPVEEVRRPE